MGYSEERKNLEKISSFLSQMGVPSQIKDVDDGEGGAFPVILCAYRYNNLDFDVVIQNIGKWIHTKCLVVDIEGLSTPILFHLYKTCLEINYTLPEVTYSSYKGNIYIECDSIVDTNFDDFEAEFNSIPDGIEALMDLVNKENKFTFQSTKGKAEIHQRKKESQKAPI
jgi:hypothetical protein